MTRPPRIVLLTGNGLRHCYVAQRLARDLSLVAVLSEAKSAAITSTAQLSPEDKSVVDRHFAERDAAEHKLLAGAAHPPQAEKREIPNGTLNTPGVFDWVRGLQPDYLVLYGSGILKAPLLEFYAGRVINLHLGLSPYYRGSGTNFWPLVNGEPECVGATIHLAVPAVDAGAILAQVRPSVDPADRVHEPGTKTIMAAADAMPRVISLFASGQLRPREQTLAGGRLYRNKDFNAGAVREAWRRLDAGMMRDYAAQREERCARFPIVEFNTTAK
jgi:folate-dependent phosphoribosylglycinamide formyltransferase PurN